MFCKLMQNNEATHSSMEIYLTRIVWTCVTFKDNFGMKHIFENYLKESWRLSSDEQFPIKYILNIAFIKEIPLKKSPAVLAATDMNG